MSFPTAKLLLKNLKILILTGPVLARWADGVGQKASQTIEFDHRWHPQHSRCTQC